MRTTNCNGRSIFFTKETRFQEVLKKIWDAELAMWSDFIYAISQKSDKTFYKDHRIVQDEYLIDDYPGSKNRIIQVDNNANVVFVSSSDMDYIEYYIAGSNETLAGIYKDNDGLYGISLVGIDCFRCFPGTLLATSETMFEMLLRMSFVFLDVEYPHHFYALCELADFFECCLGMELSHFEDLAFDALRPLFDTDN